MELFDHNRTAYEAVINHFNQGNRKACIEHATGTGKSSIIAAVAGHFDHVLVVAPNDYVIGQVRDIFRKMYPDGKAVDFKTYDGLLSEARSAQAYDVAYDLIVFDEYHHTGAEMWGVGVDYIMQVHPEARIFGTSATAVRHSDGGRDMSEELFDGHCISRLPLGEAFRSRFLMAPVYVMAVEDSQEFHDNFVRQVQESLLLEDKKRHFIEMSQHLKDLYGMQKNAPAIIRENLAPDARRVIIFSRNVDEAETNRAKVTAWMTQAGFHIAGVYLLNYREGKAACLQRMAEFQDDGYTGVKVMISVDMLNEGIHVPRVDAVFFLRKTASPTIHLQQMGRCMVRWSENGRRPVVFDFRNNIVNASKYGALDDFDIIRQDYNAGQITDNITPTDNSSDNMPQEPMLNLPEARSYIMDYMLMIERFQVDNANADFDRCYHEAKAFFDEHGHFPTQKENERLNAWAGSWWRNTYLKDKVKNQQKAEMLMAIGYVYKEKDEVNDMKWMKCYEGAKAFFDEHGHFPTQKENERLYAWAGNWWRNTYLKDKVKNQQKAEMLTDIGFTYQAMDDKWETNYAEAKAFSEEYKHFPTYKENKRIVGWAGNWWRNNYLKNPELNQEKAEMLVAIGFVHQTTDEVNDKLWRKNYIEAKAFFEEHGRFPTKKDGRGLYMWARSWWRNTYLKDKVNNQQKAEMLTDIGFTYQSSDDRFDKMWRKCYEETKKFFEEHGHFPTLKENKRLYKWAWNWWNRIYPKNKVKNQQKAEMLTAIGFEYK